MFFLKRDIFKNEIIIFHLSIDLLLFIAMFLLRLEDQSAYF